MIKATDFRLGNWIKTNIYQQVTVETLDFLTNDNFKDKSIVQPIPLTVDLLKTSGFKTTEGWADDLYSNRYFTVMARFDKFQINGIRYEVKYVHELQNIHYAFSKEELEINL